MYLKTEGTIFENKDFLFFLFLPMPKFYFAIYFLNFIYEIRIPEVNINYGLVLIDIRLK